jgi:RimJ/RimL family protein N-acetyltransferase
VKITLAPLGPGDLPRVAHIEAASEPAGNAVTMAEVLAGDSARFDLHVIEADGRPVGVFKIDRAYRRSIPIAAPGTLGLCAVMIDRERQGSGIASEALRALPRYLSRHYPEVRTVDLTVNQANGPARACYLDGGFRDTGEDWLGGRDGPQDLLRMDLPGGGTSRWRAWRVKAKRVLVRVRQRVPPGLRLLLGLLLMVGGVFAILPVLGLWMLPLGVAIAALDIVPILRWLRGRRQNAKGRPRNR